MNPFYQAQLDMLGSQIEHLKLQVQFQRDNIRLITIAWIASIVVTIAAVLFIDPINWVYKEPVRIPDTSAYDLKMYRHGDTVKITDSYGHSRQIKMDSCIISVYDRIPFPY